MRKSRLIIALTLCLVILLSVVSCGKTDAEKIIGTWEANFDIAEFINEAMAEGAGEYADYFKIDKLNVTMRVTYNEDGTCSMAVDEEKFKTEFESATSVFADGVQKLYEDMAESAGITVDEMLAAMGMTIDEIAEEMIAEMDVESMASELKADGKYKIEDGKLWISDSADEEIDENKYETYEFVDDSTLKITSYVGDDADDNPYTYPMEYKKVG